MRGGAKNLDWRWRSGQNLAGILPTDTPAAAPAATPAATLNWRRQAKWTALGMALASAVVATISPTTGPYVRAGVGYMVLSDAEALEKLAVPRGAHKEWNRRVFKNQKSESAAHRSREARAGERRELNEIDTSDAKTTADADVYREALTRCVWKDEGPATAGGLTRFNLAKLLGGAGWERRDGGGLTSRRCTVPDTEGGGQWVIRRVGPMTYTGGGDFQMMGWSNPGDLVEDALLTGWSARPVHRDGKFGCLAHDYCERKPLGHHQNQPVKTTRQNNPPKQGSLVWPISPPLELRWLAFAWVHQYGEQLLSPPRLKLADLGLT